MHDLYTPKKFPLTDLLLNGIFVKKILVTLFGVGSANIKNSWLFNFSDVLLLIIKFSSFFQRKKKKEEKR